MYTLERTQGGISNSVANFKKTNYYPLKAIDTLVLSIKYGKENVILEDLLKPFFYTNNIQKISQDVLFGVYKIRTDNTKLEIKGINKYGYITVIIHSLEKLVRDLGINIRDTQKSFGKDIKEKILDHLFNFNIPTYDVTIKNCDLAIDITFPNISEKDFHKFCNDFTDVILNMDFSYMEAEKVRGLNTGYLKSSRGDNNKGRFYNKELKEKQSEYCDYEYISTYRIEFIFNRNDVKKYMGSTRMPKVDIEKGYQRIIDSCLTAIKKYDENVENFTTGNIPQQGKRMYNKYAYSSYQDNLYNDSWKLEVDTTNLFSGRESIFNGNKLEKYYQRRVTKNYSYTRWLIDNNFIGHYQLFKNIIRSLND